MKCHRRQCRIVVLLQIILLGADCLAQNLILDVNFKRPIAVTGDAFVGITVDPEMLNNINALTKNLERSTNMARGVAPAYVRLGGPRSNFDQEYINIDSSQVVFETRRRMLHTWAEAAGLEVIACIAPSYIERKWKTWDPTDALKKLLSPDDRPQERNAGWQLGYECGTRCNLSGKDLGQQVANLREMLKNPEYSKSLIIGPDVVAYKTAQQQKYLQNYFSAAGAALSAITWHPDFASMIVDDDGVAVQYDNIVAEKEEMYKVIGRAAATKPLWIAESKTEQGKHQYLGALIWARRLGNAAKLGAQVVMRQIVDLDKATPDYWVTLLHKTLVGREVLDTKVQININRGHVHFYSQCAKPSALYEKGAVTIFGVNLTPKEVIADIKDFEIQTIHKYVLSPDPEVVNNIFSEKVLLNDKPLELKNNSELPELNPEVIAEPADLEIKLPASCIGFWVIPDAKAEACGYREDGATDFVATRRRLKSQNENVARRVGREKKQEEAPTADQSGAESRKTQPSSRQEKKRQRNNKKGSSENRQKLKDRLQEKLLKILQKKAQRPGKSDPSRLQKSSVILSAGEKNLTPRHKNISERAGKQPGLTKKYFNNVEEDADNNYLEANDDIRDTLNKYKRALLEEKTSTDAESSKTKVNDIDSAVELMTKIDALLGEEKVANAIINDKTAPKEDAIGEANGRLNRPESEDSAKPGTNATERIEEYCGILYEMLEKTGDEPKSNDIPVYELSTNAERSKRDLNKKLDNLRKNVFERHFRLNDMKNWKTKRMNDVKKGTSLLVGSTKGNFGDNGNKLDGLLQKAPFMRFLRSDALSVRSDSQRSKQARGRSRRNADRRLTETGLRRDNIFRRRSRYDDVRDYLNERKSRRRDESRKEGSPSPFSPRTADSSDENNFYGFPRQEPVGGFPEGDVFITTGDSGEECDTDYDYVLDDENDSRKEDGQQKRRQKQKPALRGNAEEETWVEADGDHRDYIPNEFFENVKPSNARAKGNSKDYGDLGEAEFYLGKYENAEDNNGTTADADVVQERPHDEKREKLARERSMQKLINYCDDSEEEEADAEGTNDDEARGSDSTLATSLGQPNNTSTRNEPAGPETPNAEPKAAFRQAAATRYAYGNDRITKNESADHRTSSAESKVVKSKIEPASRTSSYQAPARASFARQHCGNYQTSNARHDDVQLTVERTSNGPNSEVSVKTAQFPQSTVARTEGFPMSARTSRNARPKRSNWEMLREVFDKEMIREDEDNARDCRCRVIRTSGRAEQLRGSIAVKRREGPTTAAITGSADSPRPKLVSANAIADLARSKRNARRSAVQEEFERIMTGDVLPSASVIETGFDELDSGAPEVLAKSRGLNRRSNDATRTIIEETSFPPASEEPELETIGRSAAVTSPEHSTPLPTTDSADDILRVTEKVFSHAETSTVASKEETTTRGTPRETTLRITSANGDSHGKFTVHGAVENVERTTTYPKTTKSFAKKEETHHGVTSSAAKDRGHGRGNEDKHKVSETLRDVFEGTTKAAVQEPVTAKTPPLPEEGPTDKPIDDAKSDDGAETTKKKLPPSAEDEKKAPNKTATRARAHDREKQGLDRLNTEFENFSKGRWSNFAKHEQYLIKRAEQLQKLKEKLKERRKNLTRKRNQDLAKMNDERRRNLKRREAWESFCDSDEARPLNDREKLVRFLARNEENRENGGSDEETADRYLLFELVPKRYASDGDLRDQTRSRSANAKQARQPKNDTNYQPLRRPKVVEPWTSKSSDYKLFAIDPSTYRGGEPILHPHEDRRTESPVYPSKPRQTPQSPKRTMKEFYQTLPRSAKVYGGQRQITEPCDDYQYSKKPSGKDGEDDTITLYILDKYRDYEAPRESARSSPRVRVASPYGRRVANETAKAANAASGLKVNETNSASGTTERIYSTSTEGTSGFQWYLKNKQVASGEMRNASDVAWTTEGHSEQVTERTTTMMTTTKTPMTTTTTTPMTTTTTTTTKDYWNLEKITISPIERPNSGSRGLGESIIAKSKSSNDNAETARKNETAKNVGETVDKPYKYAIEYETPNDNKTADNRELQYNRSRRETGERETMDRPGARNEAANRGEHACSKDDSEETSIPVLRLVRLSGARILRKSQDYAATEIDRRDGGKSKASRYTTPMPVEDKNVLRPYEILEMRDPEFSLRRIELPKWLVRYLPRRVTGKMTRYSDNESSDELAYENLSDMPRKNVEYSDEEVVVLSSDPSNEDDEKAQKVLSEDFLSVDYESREEDGKYGAESEECDGKRIRLETTKNQRRRPDQRQMFVLLPGKSEKSTRQRRHVDDEFDNLQYESISVEDTRDINDEYLSKNNIDKGEITSEMHPPRGRSGKNHDYLPGDFTKARKNDIAFAQNDENDKNIGNDIVKNNEILSPLVEKAIPKLQHVIVGGLEKAQDLTESVEQFVDNFDEKFNETLTDEEKHRESETTGSTGSAFHAAIMNIKKFFTLFAGISRILRI